MAETNIPPPIVVKCSSPFERRRLISAFTLIEMLVAIAIIGILAALLLGEVGKIRDRARLAGDVRNLKVLFSSLALYAADNDGILLPTDGRVLNSGFRWRWYGRTPEGGNESAYNSPLVSYLNLSDQNALNRITIASVNQTAVLQPGGDGQPNAYGFPFAVNYNIMPNQVGLQTVKLASISRPASKILMADSNKKDWGPGFHDKAGWNRIGTPDGDKARVLWLDGHVTKELKEDIINNAVEYLAL